MKIKRIHISLCWQDALSIIDILNKVIKKKADKYDIAILKYIKNDLEEKLEKSTEK